MSRTALSITLCACERALLEQLTRKLTVPEYKKQRVRSVLAASEGLQNKEIAAQIVFNRNEVGKWRKRWAKAHQDWKQSDPDLRPKMDAKLILHWLSDKKGRGKKNEITPAQRAKIAGLSQETPEQYGIPVTHWTLNHLAETSVKTGIIDTISRSTVHRILKKTTCRRIEVDTG
jgi:putative transposase